MDYVLAKRQHVVAMVTTLLLFVFVVSTSADEFSVWQTDHFGLYPQLPVAFPWSLEQQCRDDSNLILSHLENQTLWAVTMVDSSARSSYATLYGNIFHMGSLDECMSVKTPILTQMCVIKVNADMDAMDLPPSDPYLFDPPPMENAWVKIRDSRIDHSKYPRDSVDLSLCVPRSCSPNEVVHALNVYLNHSNKELRLRNQSTFSAELPYGCNTDDMEPFTASEIAFWVVSALVVILAVISTIIDQNAGKTSSKGKRLLLAFSLRKNMSGFIKREEKTSPLDFLYGVKFVTILLIIMDHRMAIFLGSAVFNSQSIEQVLRGYNNFFLPHGDLLVDSFFYIAGLLSAFLSLEVFSKRSINPFLLVFNRFIRILPLYMYLVWFYASAMLRLGSGLGWQVVLGDEALFCQQNWWTNLLFINNYVHPEKMCMLHTWFLACDFHYFACCMFLMMFLVKHPRAGKVLLYVLFLIFAVVPAVIVYINNLIPNIVYYKEFLDKPREDPTFLQIYVPSHTRAAVYIAGVLAGQYLFAQQLTPKKFSNRLSGFLCLLGLGLLFAPLAYGSQLYHPGRPYDVIEASLFSTMRRVIWAMGCTVLMFTHRFGHVPLIGRMFSSHAMIVLSKLTYGSYLVHFVLQLTEYSKIKVPNHFIAYDLTTRAVMDMTFSLLYALVLYLLIEQPSRTVFRILIFSRVAHVNKPPIIPDTISSKSPMEDNVGQPNPDGTVYTVKL